MRLTRGLLCGLMLACSAAAAAAEEAAAPDRAVLFVIDGLHWEAPDRLGLTNFLGLCAQGTRVTKTWLIAPAHPRSGAWAAVHTCSLPNPILLAGTLFLAPDHPMIQDAFGPDRPALHITNGRSYESLRRGFTAAEYVRSNDVAAVRLAIERTRSRPWSFLCLHLQDTGTSGYWCGRTRKDAPGRRNIWAEGSRYVTAARTADRLLGEFLQALRERGELESTLIVVTADHGQVSSGGHPALNPESWAVPLVFAGPGVARGRVLEQAEQIDIAPTICACMGLAPPAAGPAAGRAIAGVSPGSAPSAPGGDPITLRLNEALREFRRLAAQALAQAPSQPQTELWIEEAEAAFYGPERILDWPRLGSPAAVLEANRAAIDSLKTILRGETPRWQEAPAADTGGGAD